MSKFDFFGLGRIVFGRGVFARLGELAAPLGRIAVVLTGCGDELWERAAGQLDAAGIKALRIPQIGEPKVADINQAVEIARHEGCDMALGIGGGSAIDAAKALAGILANGGEVLDYMEVVGQGRKITRPALPWIALPCTAGTGAEATRNAVIGYPEKSFKASVRSELLLPRVALVDPELGATVPADVTASSGMDALCQCIEAYTSNGANPMTDCLALEGVRRAGRSLQRAYLDGSDLEAREDMALAALLSGIALTHAGLGAVHGFAAPLGASFPVPHGTACAALLPGVMAANVAALRAAEGGGGAHPTLERYQAIACALGDHTIEEGMARVRALGRDLKIPGLGRYGLTPAQVPAMVELARKSSSMRYNPVVLSRETLVEILTEAL